MYRYYFPNRPPVLGEIPTFGLVEVVAFHKRRYVEEIDRMAWGYIVLKQPLSPSEVDKYGVISAPRERVKI